jgi:hypothetical protein
MNNRKLAGKLGSVMINNNNIFHNVFLLKLPSSGANSGGSMRGGYGGRESMTPNHRETVKVAVKASSSPVFISDEILREKSYAQIMYFRGAVVAHWNSGKNIHGNHTITGLPWLTWH